MPRSPVIEVEITEPNVIEDAEELRVGFAPRADGDEGGPDFSWAGPDVASRQGRPRRDHAGSDQQPGEADGHEDRGHRRQRAATRQSQGVCRADTDEKEHPSSADHQQRRDAVVVAGVVVLRLFEPTLVHAGLLTAGTRASLLGFSTGTNVGERTIELRL
jgi:hypothetical protein